jgi:alanyl-tRNA synthetase
VNQESKCIPRVTRQESQVTIHEVLLPSGNDIRSTFLKFFADRGHRVVRSSSLVPTNDPTLLFTNAGMNQFKDVFLGLEQREYTRATTSQKCVRAGGKHNDLENVGFTNRHHTFFEMLGNFSFGDYFKKDAIAYAWELITSPKWFGIPVDKLTFTVFGGAEVAPGKILGVDEEALNLWVNVGAPRDKVVPVPGLKENFWAMGDTGPCGPCSEIHYDMGPAASDQGHTDCKFGCDCGRYVEIWNLVFMQFNRVCDLCDVKGNCLETHLEPLPKPSVDTGAGLERLAAVLQGKISNFDTDLFQPLIDKASELTGIRYGEDFKGDASLRIIADHTRAATFLISDEVYPSRDKRGYVLRKILRRGIRHGRLLGLGEPFIYKIVDVVRDEMEGAYPELRESAERVTAAILNEEKRFGRTLTDGWREMEIAFARLIQPYSKDVHQLELSPPNDMVRTIANLPHTGGASGIRRMTAILDAVYIEVHFPGEEAFKLSDTFGVPRDFIEESCRDMGFVFDAAGYEKALAEQRNRSRASWKASTRALRIRCIRSSSKITRPIGRTPISIRVRRTKIVEFAR